MSGEFDVISQYFSRPTQHTDLGVGDDAALLTVSPDHQLVVSADMSVAGTHFFEDANPYDVGWKSLAVNISDMAAMGATPKWATLAIALPEVSHAWLSGFAKGLFECAQEFNIDLIGGDTTRGPLNVSIQIMGEVPIGKALTRAGAKVGDDIWVSGTLGNAAMGLAILKGDIALADDEQAICLSALHHPEPRANLGLALQDIASSCIDISDGLLADLTHILKASGVGAELFLEDLPILLQAKAEENELSKAHQYPLSGGEDYELCFTASPQERSTIEVLAAELNVPLTRMGVITDKADITLLHNQQPIDIENKGFDHFA